MLEMKTRIDIGQWDRHETYLFFRDFEEPYYGICMELDCTNAYEYSKMNQISFFLFYLYLTLKVVNRIEAFRYRIEGDELYLYDVIHGSATIDRENQTFGFSLIHYREDLQEFLEGAESEVQDIRASRSFVREGIGENVIHFSTLPWIPFTSVSHPRRYSRRDSIPKITYGRCHQSRGRRVIPVSVHVHHSVADGRHVGQFFEALQLHFNEALEES